MILSGLPASVDGKSGPAKSVPATNHRRGRSQGRDSTVANVGETVIGCTVIDAAHGSIGAGTEDRPVLAVPGAYHAISRLLRGSLAIREGRISVDRAVGIDARGGLSVPHAVCRETV